MSNRYLQSAGLLRALHNELIPFMWAGPTQTLEPDTAWVPKVDIQEESDAFVIHMDVPGVDPKNIDIHIEGNILTLKGEKHTYQEEKDKKKQGYRMERYSGKFYRQFTLPESVEAEQISARSKHGVLSLYLPKAVHTKKQRNIVIKEEVA